uniref:Prolyl 3,4-dihydroxylase TPA1/OFD1 N-terminal domain-containing protein n=1 Tax=Graphocephala atropunctata TaxID=36148 RepID=A0A1B6LJ56_9HEMI
MNHQREVKHYPALNLYKIKKVLEHESLVRNLAKQVRTLTFDPVENDLHCFNLTGDLTGIEDLPSVVEDFVKLMNTGMRKTIEDLYRIQTLPKISMTASAYVKGDFLLCHDDLCSDRHIAFVYYLSEDWNEDDGGALRFFDYDEDFKCYHRIKFWYEDVSVLS